MSAPGQGNQRSRNVGISTLPPSSSQNQDDSWFKYIVAASVIGTCIGNMFVARKMRSIGKWRAPTKDAHTRKPGGNGFQHPSPSNFYENKHINETNYRGPNTPQWDKAFKAPYPSSATSSDFKMRLNQKSPIELDKEFILYYIKWANAKPPFDANSHNRPYFITGSATYDGLALQPHLTTLDLQIDRISSVKEIKMAFQQKAKLLHPDSNHRGTGPSNEMDEEAKRREFTQVSESYRHLLKKMDPLLKAVAESNGSDMESNREKL